ncbi:hypothetical protein [Cloacibacterium caeni]|uniref:hypothetical protein n=1 Tax=Cloacibacterium caeni TaxID=2004710 RepID=UPI001BCE863A|nr:hypothetical protein [Cloacibacterium caeni]
MKTKKIIILTLSILLFIIPFLLLFYTNFKNQKISDNISDWGAFGDYIGGVINTLISFLTLITTIFIAFYISKIDDNRNNKIIFEENRRFIRQLRENEYNNISQEIDKIWIILVKQDKSSRINELYFLDNNFYSFIKYKKHLFPILNKNEFKKLSDIFSEIHKYVSNNDVIDVSKIPHIKDLSKEIDNFHCKIQQFIIDN